MGKGTGAVVSSCMQARVQGNSWTLTLPSPLASSLRKRSMTRWSCATSACRSDSIAGVATSPAGVVSAATGSEARVRSSNERRQLLLGRELSQTEVGRLVEWSGMLCGSCSPSTNGSAERRGGGGNGGTFGQIFDGDCGCGIVCQP